MSKAPATYNYSPGSNISRGDFISHALQGAGLLRHAKQHVLSDVPSGSYYYDAIAAAKALGIAEGDGTSFRPDDPLTRQDAMVLIYRALTVMGYTLDTGTASDLYGYDDVNRIASYATTAVCNAGK